ncbi:hypothetical protein D3C87_2123400 [compost metagenome]
MPRMEWLMAENPSIILDKISVLFLRMEYRSFSSKNSDIRSYSSAAPLLVQVISGLSKIIM